MGDRNMAHLNLKCNKSCCKKVENDINKIAKKFGLNISLEKKDNSFLIEINGHNYNEKYYGYDPIDSYPEIQTTRGLKALSKYIYDYQFEH
jgi:hypothetical protein